MLLVVLAEPAALLPQTEVLHRLVIYLGRVFVDRAFEVYLGLDYVQQRTLGGLLACLGRIENVIGARRHLGRVLCGRTYSAERFYLDHTLRYLFTWKRVLPFSI